MAAIENEKSGKEVLVLDSSDDEAVKNGTGEEGKEKKKQKIESGGGSGSSPQPQVEGSHFGTKAEAKAHLADLSEYQTLEKWTASQFQQEAERRLVRTRGAKRRKSRVSRRLLIPSQVAEGVEGSNNMPGTDGALVLGNEAAQPQQQEEEGVGNNTVEEDIQSTLQSGQRTEPTEDGNVSESASVIDLSFSCSEGEEEIRDKVATEEEKRIAEENASIDIVHNGEQADAKADIETEMSLEVEPADRNYILPVKHFRPPRYFDIQESHPRTFYSYGEENHIAGPWISRKKKKKKKPCFNCAKSGHDGMHCKKVTECFFCSKRGHLAKDCPRKDIVREQSSNFCLRCRGSGHDMFLCSSDYSTDDLERIQCYVCKAFGHLCCVNDRYEGPRSVSCYNCGENGHMGSDCVKPHENGNESQSTSVHLNDGEKGAQAQECAESEKAKEVGEASKGINPEQKNDISGVAPRSRRSRRRRRPERNLWHNNGMKESNSWAQWNGFNYVQQPRPIFAIPGSNVWLSPMAAAQRNLNFGTSTSSSQSSDRPPE